jgi:hypothetical protein
MLEVRRSRGWGRVTTALGSDKFHCELCSAVKGKAGQPGTVLIWALGRPVIRTCQPCSKEFTKLWDEAREGA